MRIAEWLRYWRSNQRYSDSTLMQRSKLSLVEVALALVPDSIEGWGKVKKREDLGTAPTIKAGLQKWEILNTSFPRRPKKLYKKKS